MDAKNGLSPEAGLAESIVQKPAATPVALPELKKVLVPVDFSEPSRKAFHYGVSFAKQFNAQVLLLHVVEPMPAPPEVIFLLESGRLGAQVETEVTKQMSEWREEMQCQVQIDSLKRSGIAYREILDAAKENNVDLIILGTHGRTGLAHLMMGSTAERVVRQASCPVLVVREREHDFVAIPEARSAVQPQ